MHTTKPVAFLLLSVALCVGFAEASPAQGGWRQWEVRLGDGRRLEANPLGAPDTEHLSLSVGAFDRRQGLVARSTVHVIAALPLPDSLPAATVVASCEDAIVRRDGKRSAGHITLAHVRWSEGVVVQRGDTIDLRDVAYLVFAARVPASVNCPREAGWYAPDAPYPVGRRQVPRRCTEACPA
jgi:hypothetical protein